MYLIKILHESNISQEWLFSADCLPLSYKDHTNVCTLLWQFLLLITIALASCSTHYVHTINLSWLLLSPLILPIYYFSS